MSVLPSSLKSPVLTTFQPLAVIVALEVTCAPSIWVSRTAPVLLFCHTMPARPLL